MQNVGRFFYILLLVVCVALLAYWSTKLLASARGGRLRGGKRNLEMIDSMGVGAQTMVQIIRAGKKYALIGVTKEKVTMLAELNESDISTGEPQGEASGNLFGNIFKRFAAMDRSESDEALEDDKGEE